MFKKKIVVALALFLSAIMLLSSGMVVNAHQPTRSNVEVELPEESVDSRTFAMSRFERITIGGNWAVTYVEAPNHAIRVVMDSGGFDHYNFNVRLRTLRIERRPLLRSFNHSVQPRIYVYAPSLESVTLSGLAVAENWSPVVGRDFAINITGAATADLDLEITRNLVVNSSGMPNLTLSGNAQSLRINGAGVTNISAFELQAVDVRPVTLAGIGTVEVTATDRLDVRAAGTTRLYFRGTPTVTQRVTGSARVIDAN